VESAAGLFNLFGDTQVDQGNQLKRDISQKAAVFPQLAGVMGGD
jgi:hypothetical protein